MDAYSIFMRKLEGRIAVVGGASRGGGRGIALALAEEGATVYVAARTSREGPKPADGAPGSVEDTAEEVTRRGGLGIAVPADLSDEAQTAALFARVAAEHGRLDVAANSIWASRILEYWSTPFWKLPPDTWSDTVNTVNASWHMAVHAAKLMHRNGGGLMVMVTDNYPDQSGYRGQILYDLGHECLNRMVMGFSRQTKKSKIAVVGLNPGFMRTERVLMHMQDEKARRQFRFDLSESPEYLGHAVVALAADDNVMRRNGELLWVADMAAEYGFTDTDGRRIPRFDPKAPVQPIPPEWFALPAARVTGATGR